MNLYFNITKSEYFSFLEMVNYIIIIIMDPNLEKKCTVVLIFTKHSFVKIKNLIFAFTILMNNVKILLKK